MTNEPSAITPVSDSAAAASDTTPRAARRTLLVPEDDKAAKLGLREPLVTGAPAYTRPTNLRRVTHAVQLFALLLFIVLLLFAALITGLNSFYQKRILPKLGAAQPVQAPVTVQPVVPAAVKVEVPAELTDGLTTAREQITQLQKQIDALRESNVTAENRLREMSERLAAQQRAAPAPTVTPTDVGAASEGQVAAMIPAVSETNKELVLLKDRNRLTEYADTAIATGSREALDSLITYLLDKDYAHLEHAVRAEIQRVYYHLKFTVRIDPSYTMPVNELFKDPAIREESDLKTEKLIELLADQKQDWQVRLRAAFLLGGRRTREVGDALVKAIKEDPVLDVAKEAQFSFEATMKHKFLLLEIPAIEQWWKENSQLSSEPLTKQQAAEKKKAPAKN